MREDLICRFIQFQPGQRQDKGCRGMLRSGMFPEPMPLSPLSAVCLCVGIGPSTGTCEAPQHLHSRRKTDSSAPINPRLPVAPQPETGLCEHLSYPCWDLVWFDHAQVSFAVTAPVTPYKQLSCCIQKIQFHFSYSLPLALKIFLFLLLK